MARGFSLIELMLVVAITGIVAAIAVPSVSQTVKKERARSELMKVVGAVEQARNRARISVCETRLSVDVATGTLTIAPNPADPDVPCRALPTKSVVFETKLITLSAFSIAGAPTNPLIFSNEGGLASPTARARMTLLPAVGAPRTIEIWPASGTVRLLR